MQGFTILELLVVTMLTSLLCLSCLGFFLDMLVLYHHLVHRSEVTHQIRTGLEVMVRELQLADSQSIQLLSPEGEGFREIHYTQYESVDLYKFYLNSSNKLIRAVKRPDAGWGYTAVADQIEELFFWVADSNAISEHGLEIRLRGQGGNGDIELETVVTTGF